MKAYLIARIDITDPDGAKTSYPKYVELAGPAYKAHGARFLVRGGTAHPMEGPARARNVVIEYASMAVGRACFGSDAYQDARKHRMAVAHSDIVLVEGVAATPSATEAVSSGHKGYWIARYDVRDPEAFMTYAQAGAPAFQQYEAVFLARGGAYDALEGETRGRNVLIEFPSVQHAIDCYKSDTYQKAREHRLPVSTGEIVIVDGA